MTHTFLSAFQKHLLPHSLLSPAEAAGVALAPVAAATAARDRQDQFAAGGRNGVGERAEE